MTGFYEDPSRRRLLETRTSVVRAWRNVAVTLDLQGEVVLAGEAGEIDMGADRLWEMSLEQNGRMDTLEFMRWRWRHGLSLSQAAEALALSRRQVAYYASGERPVPRYVLLALKGWEVEREGAVA